MNDNDIIKALEQCIGGEGCNDKCPYYKYSREVHCVEQNGHDLLDLINRQKGEIERLKDMVAQNEGVLPKYERPIKSEAIKAFAEQLNKQAFYVQETEWEGRVVDCEYINNLVEQMTDGDAQ